MDELQRQLEAFSKRYGTQGYLMKARIEILMKQGKSPEDAVRQVFREFGVEDWLQVNVAKVIVGTAQDALGKEAASTLSTAAILEALSTPWDGSGLTLSEKIHGASNVMLNDVISTLRDQIRRNKTVKDTAQALYDGYKSGHVVREQELPQYLDELTRWTRRSRENLSQEELKDLQRSIRKVRYQADDLVDDRSTYNHFRTSLRELMDKLEHGSEKAAQRALQNSIEEKSRYVAERIARTEAARARYDAFIARYGEDEDVAAYRWKLGSRHPAEDICDMYANADLYGLGKGVFPKDAAPVNPAHPHCLCHYAPVYRSELNGKKRSDNVEENGRAWLAKQPLHIRQAILGVKGEQEWKACRVGWMEKARNLSDMFGKAESRIPLVNEASHEQRWGDFNHYGGDTVKVYEGEKIPHNTEMTRRKTADDGHEIIDKPTYQKLTKSFLNSGGIIIRGEIAMKHLEKVGANASYMAGGNIAFISDDATISDVLEEMYHAKQDRANMFGALSKNADVLLKREIDAQKYLLKVAKKYKIPVEETKKTLKNLKIYEELLKKRQGMR